MAEGNGMKIDEKHKQMNRTKSVDLSQSPGRADTGGGDRLPW